MINNDEDVVNIPPGTIVEPVHFVPYNTNLHFIGQPQLCIYIYTSRTRCIQLIPR